MNWEKKDIINICKVVAFGIILYVCLQNIGLIVIFLKNIIGILAPFIVGAAIAFILNIPMTFFEKKVFKSRRKKKDGKDCKDKKCENEKYEDKKCNDEKCVDKKCENKECKEAEEVRTKKSTGKRIISIILSILIILIVIIGVIFLIIPELVNVIKSVVDYLPGLFEDIKGYIEQIIIDYPQVEGILTTVQNNLENINSEMIKGLTTLGTNLVSSSFQVISTTVGAVVDVVIAIIFSIYILMSKESICKHLKRMTYAYLSEKRADKVMKVARLSKQAFYNFLTGQFTECLILGTLCAIGMAILQIPYSLTIGCLVAITAFIPMIGAFIGAAIAVILILPVSFTKAVIFVVFFVILQQIEGNVIYPRVVGNKVGVPGILVLVTVVVGGALNGVLGMAIGLPFVAVLYTLFHENVSKRLKDKGLEKKASALGENAVCENEKIKINGDKKERMKTL